MSAPENAAKGQLGEPLAGPAEPGQAPERSKRCPKCGKVKSCNLFYRDHTAKDGRRSWCKRCCKRDSDRPERKLGNYKHWAKRRSHKWLLNDAQALHIFVQPCAYCGKSPSCGIDRRKNECGYTTQNSIPCCGRCNKSKQTHSAKEFIEMCHAVSRHCVDRETFMARNAELQRQLKEFEQWQSESTSVESAE